jgi:hypothetical protein
MADAKESTFGTITPVDGDYFRAVDDPGGSPVTANVTGTALKAYLKTYFDGLYSGTANIAYTTSDFSKTSNTTLANVTGLTHTLLASGKYIFKVLLQITCNASGGVKVAMSGTCTATTITGGVELLGPAHECTQFTALDEAEGETAKDYLVKVDGYIDVADAGTLTVKFAQNATFATASTVLAGSWFEVIKVG